MKYFEVCVEVVVGEMKNGRSKKKKEYYLVDAQSVTEAEARLIDDFVKSGDSRDYTVCYAKESRILGVISA
jgi:hypothetical protein